MGEVVNLGIQTKCDVPSQNVLKGALESKIDGAVVIGYLDGEIYFAASSADGTEVLWLLEQAKRLLFANHDAGAID